PIFQYPLLIFLKLLKLYHLRLFHFLHLLLTSLLPILNVVFQYKVEGEIIFLFLQCVTLAYTPFHSIFIIFPNLFSGINISKKAIPITQYTTTLLAKDVFLSHK